MKALEKGSDVRAAAKLFRSAFADGAEVSRKGGWTCASIKPPGTTPTEVCPPAPEPSIQRRRAQPRRDWPAIDREHVIRLRHLKAVILKEAPPVRVSAAELERRLGHREWLRKRRHVLPEANAFVITHQESVQEFQHRRLTWIIHSLSAEGLPTAWQALKAAGLTGKWVPVAECILAIVGEERSSLQECSRTAS